MAPCVIEKKTVKGVECGEAGYYDTLRANNISLVQRFLINDFRRVRTFGDGKIGAKYISLIQYFLIHCA